MAKDNLETKAKKAVINIEKKVSNMSNKISHMTDILRDVSMKFCYVIKRYKENYGHSNSNGYFK
tara:strand:+ start:143 stop:334 length:192 start_codon:yes stop_codon:yes gene_type:complete